MVPSNADAFIIMCHIGTAKNAPKIVVDEADFSASQFDTQLPIIPLATPHMPIVIAFMMAQEDASSGKARQKNSADHIPM
eukprot:8333707-Ditylum_brightwellii.AAC.1